MQLIPVPWQTAMIPLQDQCTPTPIPEVEQMFENDIGAPLSTLYDHFDPEPIGVASLAQVHRATERATGRKVAIKIMHAGLEEFCEVDMQTTQAMVKLVRKFFPTFEFGWLATEMEINLPLEMDFRKWCGLCRCVRCTEG
jgi:aarF domain-containing kinase